MSKNYFFAPQQNPFMKSLKYYFLLFGMCISIVGIGQNLQEFAEINVIPPSPNVAAFQKFVDIPVSYYTGTPAVNVPIYQIQMKQLSLPVELKYHASGLKVEEYASWVGAGWTLSAGGSISRTVKGLPDELNHLSGKKGLFANTRLFNSNGTIDYAAVEDCSYSGIYLTSDDPLTTADSLAQGFLDLEPDLYHFNVPGGAGKFSFTFDCATGPCEIVKYTDDDIEILDHPFDTPTSFPNTQTSGDFTWVLKGPDGTTYTFVSSAERTEAVSICGSTISPYNPSIDDYQSSWHLTRMENNGEYIDFTYASESQQYLQKYSESAKFKISGSVPASGPSFCSNNTTVTAKRLTQIQSSEGHVLDFSDVSARSDLSGSSRLDYISVEKDNAPVKYFELDYSYFGSNAKLKLESVTPMNGNATSSTGINGWLFEYYAGGAFPALDSKSQDYWGFYNGSANTFSMIPPYKNDLYHVNQLSAASREPFLFSTQGGTLKKLPIRPLEVQLLPMNSMTITQLTISRRT